MSGLLHLTMTNDGLPRRLHNMRKRGTGKTRIECVQCKKIFDVFKCYLPRRKFCSKGCQNTFHSQRMLGKDLGGSKQKSCVVCATKFKTYKSTDSIYCSRKCKGVKHSEIMSKERHPNWRGGIKPEIWAMRSRKEWFKIAKEIRKRDNIAWDRLRQKTLL